MAQDELPNEKKLPTSTPGNASNPPANGDDSDDNSNQLLDVKAEKYLRESGNIEDMPDEKDWQDADDMIDKEKSNKE